jgi:hypothetical protein
MKIRYLPEAVRELFEAVDYYNLKQEGLGHDFEVELETALGPVHAGLHVGTFELQVDEAREVRKVRLRRFPYALVLVVGGVNPVVVAVMHGMRRPGYWRARLQVL